jgi:hypothetical protein
MALHESAKGQRRGRRHQPEGTLKVGLEELSEARRGQGIGAGGEREEGGC